MIATVRQVTSSLGLRKFQADGFLIDRVYNLKLCSINSIIDTSFGLTSKIYVL